MEGSGLISVIVPVYNTEKYLTRCVHSLLAQTYANLEILLVDDGSTDGSSILCDRFAMEDKRVRALHKRNGGSSSARNLGIAEARGEYIGFVDSDDYVEADMYERLLDALRREKVKAAQIGRDEVAPDGSVLPDICVPPETPELLSPEKFMEELLMHRGDCSFCTKLLRAEALREFPVQQLANKPERASDETARPDRESAAAETVQPTGGETVAGIVRPDRESTAVETVQPDRESTGSGSAAGKEIKEYFPTGVLNEDFHLFIQLLDWLGPVVSLPGHAYHVYYRLGSNSRKESRDSFSRVYADNVDNADLAEEIVAEKYPALRDIAFRFGIFQRLDYMLHIPIGQMTRRNGEYRRIAAYLRRNWGKAMRNPILTRKNKIYHTLFALAPCTIRKLHRMLRRQVWDSET